MSNYLVVTFAEAEELPRTQRRCECDACFCAWCPDGELAPCVRAGIECDCEDCLFVEQPCPCRVEVNPQRMAAYSQWCELQGRPTYSLDVCEECGEPFGQRQVYRHDGRRLCARCYRRWQTYNQGRTCALCHRPIGNKSKTGLCLHCLNRGIWGGYVKEAQAAQT